MATLSIPVGDELHQKIKQAITDGWAQNVSDIGRVALQRYLDDLAVQKVLRAQKEPTLCGDLDDLASQL